MVVVVASTDDGEQGRMANKGFSSIGQGDEEEEAGRRRSGDSLVDCAVLGDRQARVPKCVGSRLTAVTDCRLRGGGSCAGRGPGIARLQWTGAVP